jgi:DNA-binding transcriptional MerR regulator
MSTPRRRSSSKSEDRAGESSEPGRYRIQTVARITGLGTGLLRTLERRYDLVRPVRATSGYREYSEQDLRILQRVRQLLDAGLSIGEITRIGRDGLLRANATSDLLPAASSAGEAEVRELVGGFVRSVEKGEVASAEEIVARALHGRPMRVALQNFVHPSLVAIGEAWERGAISPAVERLASHLLRVPLEALLAGANIGLGAVRAVCAPAPGDSHEMGAMMVALETARAGARSVHLGGLLDVEHLVSLSRLIRPRIVCLSYVAKGDDAAALARLASLRAQIPQQVRIAVGGRALRGLEEQARAAGADVCGSVDEVLYLVGRMTAGA